MSKKTLRLITVLSTILLVLVICSFSFAISAPNELTPDQNNTDGIKTFGQRLMGILQAAGIVIAVVVLMVLGIKYMMGSAEEKAEYKKVMIPYIVGAILIFAATTIANVVYNFSTGLKI